MKAVFIHEVKGYFNTLSAYVFGAFLLVFIGIGCTLYNLQAAVSNFEYVLGFACIVFVVIVPVLTMRTIAEERRQKTDRLLYSLPISTTDVVLGKFFALVVMFFIPLCVIAVYPLIFSRYGEVYLPAAYGALLAFFLLGSALLAVGMFISSLTDSQGFAAGIGIAVILFNYYSVDLARYVSSTAAGSFAALAVIAIAAGLLVKSLTSNRALALAVSGALLAALAVLFIADSTVFEGLLPRIMSRLSLFERFYDFVSGVFDLSSVVYFLTVMGFFLFLTVQSMEKRRYN